MSCHLYRLTAADGTLLYIGISDHWARRMGQHQATKPWFADVSGVNVTTYPTREDALAAERAAIKAERPLHNVAHAPRPGDALTVKAPSNDVTGCGLDSEAIEWECWRCLQPIDATPKPSNGPCAPEYGWLTLYAGQTIGGRSLWAPVCLSCAEHDSEFLPRARLRIALLRTTRMFMKEIGQMLAGPDGADLLERTAIASLIHWQVACLRGRAS